MVPIPHSTGVRPFGSDTEYLDAEFRWVTVRCQHLSARLDATRDSMKEPTTLAAADNPEAAWPDETRAKVMRLAAVDATLRDHIDARLRATREAGVVLGLDHLVQRHDLDDIERQVLLLVAMPALGVELVDALGTLGAFSYALSGISPELVAVFAGLDLAGRLRLRGQLGPRGRLVSAGLVEVEVLHGERVQDFPTASIFVTQGAFDVVVGLVPGSAADTCPSCGQPVGDPVVH